MEEMQKLTLDMKETLDVLTPLELRSFRNLLKKVDEEPRVTQVQLELEGDSTLKLARLLAKQYYASAPRVLAKVLQQLPRADLLQRWESDPAANGPGERRDSRAGSTGGRWPWGCGWFGTATKRFPCRSPGAARCPAEGLEEVTRAGRVRASRQPLNLWREVGVPGYTGRIVTISRLVGDIGQLERSHRDLLIRFGLGSEVGSTQQA